MAEDRNRPGRRGANPGGVDAIAGEPGASPEEPLTWGRATRELLRTIEPPGKSYYIVLGATMAVVAWGLFAWNYQVRNGLGVAGYTLGVRWAIYIATFVFWVGIAHSGTLISAILFLFRARWRTGVARSAEAMTVIAVMTAGLFPIVHLGRPWNFYWLMPYPNQRGLWVNFRSPLIWDVFAVSTYFTVSATFLYFGMIPDLAAARPRTSGWRGAAYGVLSLGWKGTQRQWSHYSAAYLLLAALATPLVISVHSVVSWDFAVALVPGWHSTIFAPYFVAGAIFSGLGMVLTLTIPIRRIFGLERYITVRHYENLAKLILLTSLIVTYAYANEIFIAWYGGDVSEKGAFWFRAFGRFAPLFWIMIVCNCILPISLVAGKVRTSIPALFVLSIFINIGMWLERFVIIVGSLSHDYEPWSWTKYSPTWVEISILAGSFGWFFLWFLLFVKLLPAVSISEVKEAIPPPGEDAVSAA